MRRAYAIVVLSCVFPTAWPGEAGLVAHWPFDEGAGAVLHDRSGHGNHGQIQGAKWVRNGQTRALEFDGSDDCVDCGAGASLDLRGQVSLLAWVWPEPQLRTGEPGIVGKAYSSYVITQYGETVWTYISGGPHNANAALPLQQWTHLASTYDGKDLRLYLNGRLTATTRLDLKTNAGGHFWMGRSDGVLKYTRGAHFRGKITEVRLYDRALALEEIAHHRRTTNLSTAVDVSCVPVPSQQRLLVQLDTRGLGETRPGLTVQVELSKLDSAGKAVGRPLASAAASAFDAEHKTTVALSMGGLAAGPYQVRASASGPSGNRLGLPGSANVTYAPLPTFPRGPAGAKRLNNLVTELLNVPGPDRSGRKHPFVVPRRGWVFISNNGAADVELAPEGAPARKVALDESHGAAHEAMRLLPAGNYSVSAAIAERLTVRAVPELVFARYDSNPHVREFGAYKGEFHRKRIFKNVNTFVGLAHEPFAAEWKQRGGKWLVRCGVPKGTDDKPLSVDAAYDFIATNEALSLPHIDGLIADEYGNSAPHCAIWAKAVDRALAKPEHAGKAYYPYAGDLWTGPEGIELMTALVKRGSAVAWKRYLKEQRTEADAWRFLNMKLVHSAQQYRDKCPGSLPHIVVCFGYFSAPPEQLDTFAHVNYKTYLEMQFNLVASHAAFEGIGGIMTYLASYADEETVRWAAKLFRHYGIEGRTAMLGRDPYILTHIENPDFERRGEGWTLSPAEQGSIAFDTSPGFGWLQGRYPRTDEGDTVIVTRRSARKPNVFSQDIKDLMPGKLYSLRMYTADFDDMSAKHKHGASVRMEGVTLVPEECFTHVFANCYSHHHGPYDRKHRAWMNYHWRVFRADRASAKLIVSDWASEKEPGGRIGQRMMHNFVQVQPYFAR